MSVASSEIRPCPKCGKLPRLLRTIFGLAYLACDCRNETKACATPEEAVALWNAGQFEQ